MDERFIDRSEAVRYLGYGGAEISGDITGILDECERILISCGEPRWTYREFGAADCPVPLEGESIAEHVKGCSNVILFAATLGAEADRQIRIAGVKSPARALVLDAEASAAIEAFCAFADMELAQKYAGRHLTWRFSPGYGDFPLSTQRPLLAALEADKKIGLTETEENILTPSKSVTAVIGVSDEPLDPVRRSCASCAMCGTCRFKKEDGRCGL